MIAKWSAFLSKGSTVIKLIWRGAWNIKSTSCFSVANFLSSCPNAGMVHESDINKAMILKFIKFWVKNEKLFF